MGEPVDGLGKLVSVLHVFNVCNRVVHGENSADYMQGTRLSFKSKEDAIHFAEKQGRFLIHCMCLWFNFFCQAGTTTCNRQQ